MPADDRAFASSSSSRMIGLRTKVQIPDGGIRAALHQDLADAAPVAGPAVV
jgi:hypothetical protein